MKTQHFIYCLAIVAVLFTACKKDKEQEQWIAVTGITLDKNELFLVLGDTATLIATVEPDSATSKTVTWTSSNSAVATVSNAGLVTAVANGVAIITAVTQNGNFKTACSVTVNSDYRAKWVGDWEFTTFVYSERGIWFPDIVTYTFDTISFIGTIGLYETNRLKIIFHPNATEPFPINGLIYPIVDESGELDYIGPSCSDGWVANGIIFGNEISVETRIDTRCDGPLGTYFYEQNNIQGIKINKK